MPETPDIEIADYLLDMASDLDRNGLWTGGPNFADHTTHALDVPAAAFKATTGRLPFVFEVPTAPAMLDARAYIEADPTAVDVLRTLAAHLADVWPDLDWTDDPIERLANWPNLTGVTPAEITRTMRDLAHTLTTTATSPAAA